MSGPSELPAEDINDALRDVVRAMGGNKRVGADMRPELSADAAGKWLANCLDLTRPEKLDANQIIYILKRGCMAGEHAAMHYIAAAAGYEPSKPVIPEDEVFLLQKEIQIASAGMADLMSRFERAADRVQEMRKEKR